MKTIAIAASVLALTCAARSAAADPVTSPEQQKLSDLIGMWKGSGTLTFRGKTFAVKASRRCRAVAGATAVACEFDLTGFPGEPKVVVSEIFGYDGEAKEVLWAWACNIGGMHSYSGSLAGDTLEAQDAGSRSTLVIGKSTLAERYASKSSGERTALDLAFKRTK